MRKTKRILSVMLAVALAASFGFPASASELPFTDITENSTYYEAIQYVYDNNIMNGLTDTYFGVSSSITRGMLMTILYRLSGSTMEIDPEGFTDVAEGSYYYYPIGWAQYNGIANGTTTTTFEPDTALTKQQIITFLYRYATEYEWMSYEIPNEYQVNLLRDYSSITDYARESANWALNCGIVPSTSVYFYPHEKVTRGVCAEYLYKFMTLAFGDARVLTSSDFTESYAEMGPIIYDYLIEAGYDATIQNCLTPLAIEFAFYNADVIYSSSHGDDDCISLDGGYLYDFDIADDSMTQVDLVYISACKAGGSFCAHLSQNAGARYVVGFTDYVGNANPGEGFRLFEEKFFEYYAQGYSPSTAAAKAVNYVPEFDRDIFGVNSCVVYYKGNIVYQPVN